jgi:DNA-binding response OmpR family regulator
MSPASDTATLVLVSPFEEDHFSLARFLISTGFRVHRVRTRQEALAVLRNNRVAVVISERDLPEGDWKDVLRELTPLVDAPFLIVTFPARRQSSLGRGSESGRPRCVAKAVLRGRSDSRGEPDLPAVGRPAGANARQFGW